MTFNFVMTGDIYLRAVTVMWHFAKRWRRSMSFSSRSYRDRTMQFPLAVTRPRNFPEPWREYDISVGNAMNVTSLSSDRSIKFPLLSDRTIKFSLAVTGLRHFPEQWRELLKYLVSFKWIRHFRSLTDYIWQSFQSLFCKFFDPPPPGYDT
jgi:hypothetical protein